MRWKLIDEPRVLRFEDLPQNAVFTSPHAPYLLCKAGDMALDLRPIARHERVFSSARGMPVSRVLGVLNYDGGRIWIDEYQSATHTRRADELRPGDVVASRDRIGSAIAWVVVWTRPTEERTAIEVELFSVLFDGDIKTILMRPGDRLDYRGRIEVEYDDDADE